MKRKKLWIGIAAALVVVVVAITVGLLWHEEQRLEELRNAALEQLERDEGQYDEQSIVLNNTSKAKAEKLAELYNAKLRITENGRFATLTLPEGTTIRDVYAMSVSRQYIDEMSADYHVKISELTEEEQTQTGRDPVRPQYTVTDPDYELQTYLDYLNMGTVWNHYTGTGITVAVIDTGIDTDHPEFDGRISEYSYNASEDKIVKDFRLPDGSYDWSLVEDEQGHGTAVTGVIAAAMDGSGTVGIAPNVEIIVIKAECDQFGNFYRASDLVYGIYYAIERDVHVVNMSFGGKDNIYSEALQLAYDSDIICVASAGNNSTSGLHYPSSDENVIGVGALEDSWELAYYSNYGENLDIVAPGTTYTTAIGGGYRTAQGTSLAAPVVTAAVALFMQTGKYQTFDDVTEVLYASCYDLGDLGRDWLYGFGALDVNAFILEERGKIIYDMLTDELENEEGIYIQGHALQELPEPERLYAVFDGWYYDDTFTQQYDYYADKFYGEEITLYAKWANEDDGVPYTYVILDDGTVEIRSYTGNRRYITVPEMIEDRVVSSIGDFAFANQTRLREVTLPDGLTAIGDYAFDSCSNLVSIEIPEGVKSIGYGAFYDNVRLNTVGFRGNSSLTTIGGAAFHGCSRLETIELPASLENVDGSAFEGTTWLRSIMVQNGNTSFASRDGVLFSYSGSTLVAFPAAWGTSYTLPENTTTIGSYAFAYAKLSQIDLTNVTAIEGGAFIHASLTSVSMSDGVHTLGKGAFAYNEYLTSVTLGCGIKKIDDSVFVDCKRLRQITIPKMVQEIGKQAFAYSGLTNVTIEEGSALRIIKEEAFFKTELQEIAIPDSVEWIGSGVFKESKLKKVEFGQNSRLDTIGTKAFSNCSELEEVVLPASLTMIAERAFESCGLPGVTIPAGVLEIGYGAFSGCPLFSISVEEGNARYYDVGGILYCTDKNGGTLIHTYPAGIREIEYTVADGVVGICPYAFAGTKNLRYVYLPETMTVLGEYSFSESGIISINLPESLQQIEEGAFSHCESLKNMHIPDNVIQIGPKAFAHTRSLTAITFNETSKLPRIGFQAFAQCGITSFRVPANVSTIAQKAFEGCTALTSITFAENSKLESIPAYLFNGCNNLQTIVFEQGSALKSIQAHGLEGMDKLTNVDFGDAQLTNIDNFAFRFCGSLTNLELPETLLSVGRYAFYCCESLSQLSFPENLEHIGSYAFLGTADIELFFQAEIMPAYLDENWDNDVRGYYTGVSYVAQSGDYRYAVLNSGNIAILEYLGSDSYIDLTTVELGGDITIIGGSAFEDSTVTAIVLPETLTMIQAEAFRYCGLSSVTIPASVTFIGREAFALTDIATLTFAPNAKVSVIEQYAFQKTTNLKNVTLPASLTIMGTGAFQESGLESLSFAEGFLLEEIPQKAFTGTAITSLVLPDSVTLVNHNAFSNVSTLKSITFGNNDGIRLMSNAFYHTGLESLHIPANVLYIGEYCFIALENLHEYTVDAGNPNYTAVDGLLLSKNQRKLIAVPAGMMGSLTVPASVESIGFGAFEESDLSEVLFYEDANILTIGYRAFFNAKNITSIAVPKSVISIDYYAFAYCDNLHTVTFAEDNQIKGIYEGAFLGDIRLENIVIPDSIVEISDFAFYGCSKIDALPISEYSQVKGVYDYAFAYSGICGDFTTPETLIDIGNYAFMNTEVTSVTVPDANQKALFIGIGAFENCNALEEITLPFVGRSYEDDEVSWLGYIFGAGAASVNEDYIPASLKTVTITEGITTLYEGSFAHCPSLETIHMPHSVSVVWADSFNETTANYELTNVITPCILVQEGNLENVYYRAQIGHFGVGLQGTLVLDDRVDVIGSDAFKDHVFVENVVLPDSLATIEGWAFSNCTSLKEVVIPESVTYFGDQIWLDCVSLEKVVFPETMTVVPGAFIGCTSLEEVVLPESVTSIGASAFGGCSSLKKINIPDSVTSIGAGAFGGCSSLKEIDIPNSVTEIGGSAFSGTAITQIDLPDDLTKLGNGVFSNCKSLKSVVIPDGVKEIAGEMFYGCESLESVQMASDATFTGSWIFRGCTSLKSITIPNGVETIPEMTFYDCTALTDVTIPASVKSIGYNAFASCMIQNIYISNLEAWCAFEFSTEGQSPLRYGANLYLNGEPLTNLVIPETVASINAYAFFNCRNIEKVTIPANITSVGDYAFYGCEALTSVNMAEGATSIGSYAFHSCKKLQAIAMPDTVTTIGDYAFQYCESLSEVQIPASVTSIGQYTFYDCRKLSEVELPVALESIGDRAFYRCAISSITIPESVTQIGDQAFCENYQLHYVANNSDLLLSFGGTDQGYVACYAKVIEDKAGNQTNLDGTFVTADGFVFTTADGAYTLISYIGGEKTIKLPESVNGRTYSLYKFVGAENVTLPSFMTVVPDYAFAQNVNLKHVTLSSKTTVIGNDAFNGCSALTQINLPEGITTIGEAAFGNCSSLTEIVIPDSVTTIGAGAFGSCSSIKHISVPNGVTVINRNTFSGCNSLQSVTIPESVTEIGSDAFSGCTSLSNITLSEGLKSIGGNAFSLCHSLKTLVIPDSVYDVAGSSFPAGAEVIFGDGNPYFRMANGILYNADMTTVIYASKDIAGEIILPDTVTVIASGAFKNCTRLTRIVLQEGVTEILYGAFSYCTALTEVIMPQSLWKIDSQAFMGCSSLTRAAIPDGVNNLGTNIFSSCGFTEYMIPSGMEYIPNSMFSYCENLISVIIPKSVTGIGEYAFSGCSNLRSINIPESITYIGYCAFNMTNVKRVDIEDINAWINITFEGSVMHYEGAELYLNGTLVEHVVFPKGTTAIGKYVLYGCSSLKSVEIPDTVTSIGASAFASCSNLKSVVIPEGVTAIEDSTFSGCSNLQSVTIPNTVTRIGGSAFSGCTSLKNIAIPDGVTEIGGWGFEGCSSLESVKLPAGMTVIQPYTFFDCERLKIVVIPKGVTEIGYNAFYSCTVLEEVTIPESVTSIGSSAFYNCPELRKIHISSVDAWCNINFGGQIYGGTAFFYGNLYQNGELVTTVKVPADVSRISDFAFHGFSGIEHVVIPETVTAIGNYAFMNCTGLRTVTLAEGLTSIGDSAFYSCTNLMSVVLPDSVESIGNHAFGFCDQLHKVVLGKGLNSIGSDAFLGSVRLYYVVNRSGLPVSLGNLDYGYLSYNAKILEDAQGNQNYLSDSYLLTEEEFLFEIRDGKYVLIAYLGDKETVTLPLNVNGQTYQIDSMIGVRNVIIPEGITEISNNAFYNCNTLLSVTIPDTVTKIGSSAFQYCRYLRSVHIPDSVTEIGDNAFWYCEQLREATLSNQLTYIPSGLFGGCGMLEKIVIPECISSIGGNAFSGCSSLINVVIPENVISMGIYAFADCTSLYDVNIPEKVMAVGNGAFQNCVRLYENPEMYQHGVLVIDGWLIDVDEDLLYLANLDEIRNVEPWAYNDCSKLKNFWWCGYNMPANVETIYISSIDMFTPNIYNSLTLKNIIISDNVGAADLRHKLDLLANVTGVTIWVEEDEENLRWDDNFPGWNNGNRVYYGDEWTMAEFYDADGRLVSSEPRSRSQIIHRPVYEIEADQKYTYELVGWDLNGDGIADSVPAVSDVNLTATPVVMERERMYTIQFADRYSGVAYSTLHLPYGAEITLPGNVEKRGYTFLEWDIMSEHMTVTQDLVIYARWLHDGNGHNYGQPVWIDATCTEPGYFKHTCSVCGEYYQSDVTEALEHDYKQSVVAPQCTLGGYTLHSCARCNDSYRDAFVKATGHSYGDWITDQAAQCTQTGTQHRICESCGNCETGVIAATGHSFKESGCTESTCTTAGKRTFRCSDCGTTVQESLPLATHDYEKEYASMGFLEWLIRLLMDVLWGYEGDRAYYYACENCGSIMSEDEAASNKVGVESIPCRHTSCTWTTIRQADCVGRSVDAYICDNCDAILESRIYGELAAHKDAADDYDHVCDNGCGSVVEQCTMIYLDNEDGSHDYVCSVCGTIDQDDVTHDFSSGDCVCGAKKPGGLLGDLDLDGDVDAYDLTMLARYVGGIELITDATALKNADVDGDGDIDAYDLTKHARYVGGIITDWNQD